MEIKLNDGTELDMAEWIAGAMGVSKGTAYEWMESALAARYPSEQKQPLEPVVPQDADINQRISFKAGWRAAEAAHGITGEKK